MSSTTFQVALWLARLAAGLLNQPPVVICFPEQRAVRPRRPLVPQAVKTAVE
ncbi:hypothetical protein ACN28C_07935 [Plantactinospora sp. WMMC1484]|uniref:hypothetical protein n=1 Tax=Plantactinospora sp. WMMC1484 TaxID=3404122 RepID=UPI003BF4AF3C